MTTTPILSSTASKAHGHPGLFISFEGGDGVGKTTQIQILADFLRAKGIDCCLTREPGGTDLGVAIRQLLLNGGQVSARAEALLYAADRAHHVETVVRPALARGQVVVTDRYLDSSIAYQGVARDLGASEVAQLSLWAAQGLLPDLTILLDAPPQLAARRRSQRGEADRLEREPKAFHLALREEFLALAAQNPHRFVVIDADRQRAQVAADVQQAFLALAARREVQL